MLQRFIITIVLVIVITWLASLMGPFGWGLGFAAMCFTVARKFGLIRYGQ